jgi:F0F1-type ATP synthase assembly protein I
LIKKILILVRRIRKLLLFDLHVQSRHTWRKVNKSVLLIDLLIIVSIWIIFVVWCDPILVNFIVCFLMVFLELAFPGVLN